MADCYQNKAGGIFPGIFFMVITSCFFTSCSTLVTDPSSPYYIPAPGSIITIHQQLVVPPNRARVFLQNGNIVSYSELDEYTVNCDIEINTISEKPRYIPAGKYIVIRTTRDEGSIVKSAPAGKAVQVAAISGTVGFPFFRRDAPSPMFESIIMRLKSEKPSDVRQITCRGEIADPWEMELPTVKQIRKAFGKYVSIQLPEEK